MLYLRGLSEYIKIIKLYLKRYFRIRPRKPSNFIFTIFSKVYHTFGHTRTYFVAINNKPRPPGAGMGMGQSRQISVPVPGLASHRCRDSMGFVSHWTIPAVPAKISFLRKFKIRPQFNQNQILNKKFLSMKFPIMETRYVGKF